MRLSFLNTCQTAWIALSLLWGTVAFSQTLEAVPSEVLKQNRDRYFQALEDWQKSDPTLEKDLHISDRERVLQRINEQDRRTKQFLDAKKMYFHSLRAYLQAQGTRVQTSAAAGPEEASQLQQSIDGVTRDRHDLDDQIAQTREPEIRQKLRMQQAALETIQKNLEQQKYLLERMNRADAGIAETRTAMQNSIKRVSDVLAEIEKGTDEEEYRMARVYDSMRQTAGTPLLKGAEASGKDKVDQAQQQSRQSTLQVGSPSPSPLVPNITNTPGPAPSTRASGTFFYGPVLDPKTIGSIRITLNAQGGTLTADRIPKSLGLPGELVEARLSFVDGRKYSWSAQNQNGLIEILPAGDKIEIVWKNSRGDVIFDNVLAPAK